jgi:hypothetical protein
MDVAIGDATLLPEHGGSVVKIGDEELYFLPAVRRGAGGAGGGQGVGPPSGAGGGRGRRSLWLWLWQQPANGSKTFFLAHAVGTAYWPRC